MSFVFFKLNVILNLVASIISVTFSNVKDLIQRNIFNQMYLCFLHFELKNEHIDAQIRVQVSTDERQVTGE